MTQHEITEAASTAKTLARSIGRSAWELGAIFQRVHEATTASEFANWLIRAGGYSLRTAQQLMRVSRVYQSPDDVPEMVTAAYILSATFVPEKARKEATRLKERGVAVTPAVAKSIVEKHVPERPVSPPVLTPASQPVELHRTLSDARDALWDGFRRDVGRMNQRQMTPEHVAKRNPLFASEAMRRLAADPDYMALQRMAR